MLYFVFLVYFIVEINEKSACTLNFVTNLVKVLQIYFNRAKNLIKKDKYLT